MSKAIVAVAEGMVTEGMVAVQEENNMVAKEIVAQAQAVIKHADTVVANKDASIDDIAQAVQEANEALDAVVIATRRVGIIEKKNISWSCKQLAKMVKKFTLRFDHIVQRSLVWEKERKSKLIESILIGFPIPPVWAKQRVAEEGEVQGRSNKLYDILDGKQRLNTIAEFLNDEFALCEMKPMAYEDDLGEMHVVNISGMKFSELPEELQDAINNANISVNYFDGLSAEEERELFNRLNNGKPLSTKAKLLANCTDIVGILDIGSHPLFEAMMSAKARANKNQVAVVMKAWCMLNQDIADISFESKTFNPLVEETQVTADEKAQMLQVFDFIVEVHDIIAEMTDKADKAVAKKLYKETHMVSMIPFMVQAIETGVSASDMADFVVSFFKTSDKSMSVSALYNESAQSGVAKHSAIVGRHSALEDAFSKFFGTAEDIEEDVVDDADEMVVDDADDADEFDIDNIESLTDRLLDDEVGSMDDLLDSILG